MYALRSGDIDIKATSLNGEELNAKSKSDPYSAQHINIKGLRSNNSKELVKKFQDFYNKNERLESCLVSDVIFSYNNIILLFDFYILEKIKTERNCIEA